MTPISESPLLETRGLTKVFSSGRVGNRRVVRAVDDLNLQVLAGQAIGLVGESGSGKSTVARLIARLMPPTSGQILLKGRDVIAAERRRASRSYRHDVQMIFQDPFSSLNPVHTVGYHLNRSLRVHDALDGRRAADAAAELLDAVGLSSVPGIADRFPHELSGGQRQRVAIARTLAARPSFLVADEPTSMLDVSVRVGILNTLTDLRQERDIGLLLITHDLASARYSTSHTLVMFAGRILEYGPSEQLIDDPKHPYTQLLISSVPRRERRATAVDHREPAQPAPPSSSGCPFAPRCPSRLPQCTTVMPGVESTGAERWVRCHLFGPGEAQPAATAAGEHRGPVSSP
jgi:peptide/nickel transport system ATP-binding protein